MKTWVPDESGFDGAGNVITRYMDGDYGIVILELPYLDVNGNGKMGLAQLLIRREDGESGKRMPVFLHTYYTLDMAVAKRWCDRGWAVVMDMNTGTGGKYPLGLSSGDGGNQARATFQWIRRLPFVDRTHIHVDGISQGAYVALDLGAEMFPIASVTADSPLVNWDYCMGYVMANKGPAQYPQVGKEDSPIPLLNSIGYIADWSAALYGADLSSDSWYYLSPISYVDRITSPVLLTCASGDVLLPMEQMSTTHFRPFNPSNFPAGYVRDFDTLTANALSHVTLEEVLTEGNYSIQVKTLQANAFEIIPSYYTPPAKAALVLPAAEDKPWDHNVQWSLLYLDEGEPMPYSGHTRYTWVLYPDSFTEYYKNREISPALLNAAKLHRLMERYTFTLENLPWMTNGHLATRLNFPDVEQRDVLQGLLDYATISSTHEQRLKTLYGEGELKPLGSTISIASLQAALAALGI